MSEVQKQIDKLQSSIQKQIDALKAKQDTINAIKDSQISLKEVDWSVVYATATDIIKRSLDQLYSDESDAHYIFEVVMNAIYGKDFFKKYNKLGI